MKRSILVLTVLLFLLCACERGSALDAAANQTTRAETTAPATWQEAYASALAPHDFTTFWLADADGNGTPELYRLMEDSNDYFENWIEVYDFTRGGLVSQKELSGRVLYLDNESGTLGFSIHEDAHTDARRWNEDSYEQWRYENGRFALVSSITNAQEYKKNSEQPVRDVTADRKAGQPLGLKEFEIRAAAFNKIYRQAIPYYSYHRGMDLNECLRRPPATWQEAYTVIMQHNDDAVGNHFFLVDADGNGTPELYRISTIHGYLGVTDFAYEDVLCPIATVTSLCHKPDGILGIYTDDAGPTDEGSLHYKKYMEYQYVDGEFRCISSFDVTDYYRIGKFDRTIYTMNDKNISLKEYNARAAAFHETYDTYAVAVQHYEEGMDLNTCWPH